MDKFTNKLNYVQIRVYLTETGTGHRIKKLTSGSILGHMRQEWEFPRQVECSAWEMYARHIRPDMRVAVVGPSASVTSDPSLFQVCTLVGPHGMVYIADPLEDISSKRKISHMIKAGWIEPVGGVMEHTKDLQRLQEYGLSIPFQWLGPDSGILNLKTPEPLDVIVDHATSQFVLSRFGSFIRPQLFKLVFQEYRKRLAPHGELILQVNNARYGYRMEEHLVHAGFYEISHHIVSDDYRIPVSENVFRSLKKLTRQPEDVFSNNTVLLKHIREEADGYWLYFDQKDINHPSPDMYIAIK